MAIPTTAPPIPPTTDAVLMPGDLADGGGGVMVWEGCVGGTVTVWVVLVGRTEEEMGRVD